jgi:hypothetical protein
VIARHLKKVALAVAAILSGHAAIAGAGGLLPDVRARTTHERLERPAGVPSDEVLESAHAHVGTVTIVTQNIFDTARPEEDKKLFRLANDLHISTRPATIRSQLLFAQGQEYDGRLLQESERILRGTR